MRDEDPVKVANLPENRFVRECILLAIAECRRRMIPARAKRDVELAGLVIITVRNIGKHMLKRKLDEPA